MSEAPTEELPALPSWAFECEREPPQHAIFGFQIQGGNVNLDLGYMIYPLGVVLIATVKIGDSERRVWRRHWASREAAVEMAEQMVYDAEDYLFGTLGLRPRPVEDLDPDHFMHHLDMRLNNGFH